jgi:hypothetical protein
MEAKEANPLRDIVVDIGPVTLADAIAARGVLEAAGPSCAALAAMLRLRIAQSERAAVLELRAEADELLPILPDPVTVRPEAFPKWRGVPGRWL